MTVGSLNPSAITPPFQSFIFYPLPSKRWRVTGGVYLKLPEGDLGEGVSPNQIPAC
ncbi:unnamed protein product [marine sediment metagenome]|uniref:Uncharacterized protein n=1 Tax=marine sediment metagenome TaxID=412755 RepID=X1MUX1_9ZZZZ